MAPTLLSALQARRSVPRARADVVILYLGRTDGMARAFGELCVDRGIRFQVIQAGDIDDLPIQFARHFLDRLLPPEIEDVIHLDGDTQVIGSLEPLLDTPTTVGRVMAVRDPMAVMIHHPARAWRARRAYFRSIGIPEERLDRYFNTGLFRIRRSDAGAIGRECVRLCRQKGAAFRYSEQDAFNIAFGGATDLISFKWNFPVFFLNGGFQATIEPHLVHYMSNPRPWQGAFAPWGLPAHRPYLDLAAAYPQLATYLQPLRGFRAAKYVAQQHAKRLVERRTWTRAPVRERIEQFEREAAA